MFGVVSGFRQNVDDFREIARQINSLALKRFGTRQLTPAQKQQLKAELIAQKQTFCDLVGNNLAKSGTEQYMPPPPRSKELYGRVADQQPIVDVGSGNLTRLVADSGRLKITAIDPALSDIDVSVVKCHRQAVPEDVQDKVVTSFNVLPNLDPAEPLRKQIVEEDGLHVIPDHQSLSNRGIGQWINGRYVVSAPRQKFADFPVQGCGVDKDGYKLVSFIKQRAVSLTVPPLTNSGDYCPKIDGSPGDPAAVNWLDVGWKWDGEPYELEVMPAGHAMLTRRNGDFAEFEGGGLPPCSLHLEKVENKGFTAWVLLRVEFFNGFVPPHSGEFLRYFAQRVNIRINGADVYGPPELDLVEGPRLGGSLFKVDGIISRFEERDRYYKPGWTVDVLPDGIAYMRECCDGSGILFECAEVSPALSEYRITRVEGRITATFVRERTDKRLPTTQGTIAYILGLPTLVEVVALSGATPMTTALRDYFLEL